METRLRPQTRARAFPDLSRAFNARRQPAGLELQPVMGSVNGVLLPPPSVLVAEENGPGVQRPGLDELQVDPVSQVLEQRLAAAQHNRVDNDVVFVDQPEPREG